ncbi:MAG: hypothetical protein Q3962_06820 [Corynebacterium sp.]|nr:hypothetical protein [Corynebacterium sp.]
MSSTNAPTNARGESFPVFEGTPEYVKGYVPANFFNSPESGLHRLSTWFGMALILSIVTGLGSLTFGAATYLSGTQTHALWYVWFGIIEIVLFAVIGTALIKYGCRDARKFKNAHPELYGH